MKPKQLRLPLECRRTLPLRSREATLQLLRKLAVDLHIFISQCTISNCGKLQSLISSVGGIPVIPNKGTDCREHTVAESEDLKRWSQSCNILPSIHSRVLPPPYTCRTRAHMLASFSSMFLRSTQLDSESQEGASEEEYRRRAACLQVGVVGRSSDPG